MLSLGVKKKKKKEISRISQVHCPVTSKRSFLLLRILEQIAGTSEQTDQHKALSDFHDVAWPHTTESPDKFKHRVIGLRDVLGVVC